MNHTRIALAMVIAVTAGVAAPRAQTPDGSVTVSVSRSGAPAPNVAVDLQLLNRGKVAAGTTGPGGDLSMLMSIANLGKATRMQVVIYDCPNDLQRVVFVETGAAAPENVDCKKRVAGWFWFGRARAVMIDLTRATVATRGGQSFLGSTRGRLIAGGGAAAVGLVALSAGGGDSSGGSNTGTNNNSGTPGSGSGTPFEPNGNYPVTNAVFSDPGEHRIFIALENNTVLVITISGSNVTVTCPPGSKWTLLSGTYNPSTGQLSTEGRGTAAGRSNVLFRFNATITTSGSNQGAIAGQLTVGAGGELPGGQAIVYTVTGKRQ
jgi:hypothetical protein